jgi:hypothetical protein
LLTLNPKPYTLNQVLQMLFGESQESEERREEETMDVRKIIYCSRTHSQLSQFMREVKRVILKINNNKN